uniref:Amidase domain-containing protein n=1 Tax=Bionectria ochroleuca TaxID=29856 RepID=A0A8H7N2M7_BIOOC
MVRKATLAHPNVSIEEEVKLHVNDIPDTISQETLSAFRSEVLDRDDVFQSDFARTIVFHGSSESEMKLDSNATEELARWGSQTRLDSPEAGIDGRVMVPSRCYFKPSPSRPLDGVRVGVKDNFDIAGHKTTLNNLAWRDLYPPADKNAHCVQLLIDAGAIIVGKHKLQALIVREEPVEAVEFTDPFNPRCDGYQVPSGSSSGSAAAIGSYDWLDLSLGSDTNGSVRKPAHYNGCHTIRPTTGIMNTEGVVGQFPCVKTAPDGALILGTLVPLSLLRVPEFDMPGFFGRDLAKFKDVISVWYGDSPLLRQPSSEIAVEILYPLDYLPTRNAEQTEAIDKFVSGLESAFKVKRTPVSIAKAWKDDLPDGTEHGDIAKYLETAGIYPFFYDGYHALEPFRREYHKKFGRAPFVHRYVKWQWEVAKGISKEERDECWCRCQVYRKWLLSMIFSAESKDSIKIMVLPIEAGEPNYRDSPEPPYGLLNGYASLNMSPIMRAPEITAIVGQISFHSVVTERKEPYPIGASVIGPPGSDLLLSELTTKGMEAAGIPIEVKTGRSVY